MPLELRQVSCVHLCDRMFRLPLYDTWGPRKRGKPLSSGSLQLEPAWKKKLLRGHDPGAVFHSMWQVGVCGRLVSGSQPPLSSLPTWELLDSIRQRRLLLKCKQTFTTLSCSGV